MEITDLNLLKCKRHDLCKHESYRSNDINTKSDLIRLIYINDHIVHVFIRISLLKILCSQTLDSH